MFRSVLKYLPISLILVVSTPVNAAKQYLGIPYAKPPVNELRWAPPVALDYDPARSTESFGAACVQDDYNVLWYQDVAASLGYDDYRMPVPTFSEDCLYLNIWAPEESDELKPVMVWIHGGANQSGWSHEPNYLGANLADNQDVLVVSLNYRLGIFGFFSHPELEQANFGLLDQITALEWIQKNIKRFGGDPNNVTLFGESAGGADIGYLLHIERAQSLFNRAIVQSGGFELVEFPTKLEEQKLIKKLEVSDHSLTSLRETPALALFDVARRSWSDHYYNAVSGDGLLEASSLSQPYTKNLLIGTNLHEWKMYLPDDAQAFAQGLKALPKGIAPHLQQAKSRADTDHEGYDRAMTLYEMRCPSYIKALNHNEEARTWVYQFDRVRKGMESIGAYHGAEISYVFSTHDDWLPTDAIDRKISKQMQAVWGQFAHTGELSWSTFSDSGKMMVFAQTVREAPAMDWDLCQAIAPAYLSAVTIKKNNNNKRDVQ